MLSDKKISNSIKILSNVGSGGGRNKKDKGFSFCEVEDARCWAHFAATQNAPNTKPNRTTTKALSERLSERGVKPNVSRGFAVRTPHREPAQAGGA